VGKTNFTKKDLGKLAPAAKRFNVLDPETRGLGLVVHPSGEKVFFHQVKVLGYPRRTTLGSFDSLSIEQARGEAARINADLAKWKLNNYQGPAPFEKKQQGEPTFSELLKSYIDKRIRAHSKNPERVEKELWWAVDRHLASWKNRKIGTIRRADVLKAHADLGEEHKFAANRLVELIRGAFNFATQEELFRDENPAAGVKAFHEASRTRFLQPEELARLFTALRKKTPADLRDFVNLSLWTGARKSDVLSMRWENISLADNKWEVPDPKSRAPYVIALTPEAVEILRARHRQNGNSPWVFPSKLSKSGHVVNVKKPWQRLLKKAKITDLRIHDLRRTLGSWQAATGASLPVIGKSLGHGDGSSATAVYARLNLDPVRESVLTATRAMIEASKKKPKLLKAGSR
jgi:integrase